jgi:hexosaminidase
VSPPNGGFRLHIAPEEIAVAGADRASMMYAFDYLFAALAREGQVACGVVEDYPRFAVRALQIDLGRQIECADKILEILDFAAAFRYNWLHLYCEGGLRFDRHPAFSDPDERLL